MGKIDTSNWKEFVLSDVFEMQKQIEINPVQAYYDDGDGIKYPFYGQSKLNNGIISYLSLEDKYLNNKDSRCAILIHSNTHECVLATTPFYLKDGHGATSIFSNCHLNVFSALYIMAVLTNVMAEKYDYDQKATKESLKVLKLLLPVGKDGNPDYLYMERYMKNQQNVVKTVLAQLQLTIQSNFAQKIDTTEWKSFYLYDIFKIDSGTKLDKGKMDTTVPEVNFVGRSNFNNGITQKVNEIQGLKPYEAGNLTLALGGAYLGSCFIQEAPFYTSQNVAVLIPKKDITFEAKQFIATVIFKESQNNYRAFIKELNAHIKRDFVIKLPAQSNGEPDYDYMTAYIKRIKEKSSHVINLMKVI